MQTLSQGQELVLLLIALPVRKSDYLGILSYILFLSLSVSQLYEHFVVYVFGAFDSVGHNEWHFPSITLISLRSGIICPHLSVTYFSTSIY